MPICGTKESLNEIDRDAIINYYNRMYRPQNAVISVAGNIDTKKTLDLIESFFGNWDKGDYKKNVCPKATYIPTILSINKDIEQVHMCFVFKALERENKHKYSIAVLNTLFGGGMSSRLFQKIREEKVLVYTVYSYTSAYKDTGVITVYACTSRQNVKEVVDSVMDEIKVLKAEKIDDNIISSTKEQIISNYILGNESTSSRLNSNGGALMLTGKIKSTDEVIEKIEAVNYDTIKETVDIIFNGENLSFSAVGNVKGIDFERMMSDARQGLYI